MQQVMLVGYVTNKDTKTFKSGKDGINFTIKVHNGDFWNCTVMSDNVYLYRIAESLKKGTVVSAIGTISSTAAENLDDNGQRKVFYRSFISSLYFVDRSDHEKKAEQKNNRKEENSSLDDLLK